jgi:quinol-cytochrome oxidoreductase complex cytochrome b subunit
LGRVIDIMAGSLLVLFLIPFTNTSPIRSTTFRPLFKIFYWLTVADFVFLIPLIDFVETLLIKIYLNSNLSVLN